MIKEDDGDNEVAIFVGTDDNVEVLYRYDDDDDVVL